MCECKVSVQSVLCFATLSVAAENRGYLILLRCLWLEYETLMWIKNHVVLLYIFLAPEKLLRKRVESSVLLE